MLNKEEYDLSEEERYRYSCSLKDRLLINDKFTHCYILIYLLKLPGQWENGYEWRPARFAYWLSL